MMWLPHLLQILQLCYITSALTLQRDDTTADRHPERRLQIKDVKSSGDHPKCAGKCQHPEDPSNNFHVSFYHINDVHA
jgi:hypothetical protein